MTDENNKQGFKVSDKRRFDAKGEETKRSEPVHEKSASNTSSQDDMAGKPAENKAGASGAIEINFSSFVMSLATQAIVQLGEMPAPSGVQIDVDTAAAKQTIDILSMIKEKTTGNLDQSEEALIEEILHTLRMSYVKHAR